MEKLIIKGLRQRRALEVLLKHKSISISDIGLMIGALNPRQTIFELRRQGFYELIQTRRFEVLDRDGKVCRPGEYFIPEHSKFLVEEALKKYTTQAIAVAQVASNRNDNKANLIKRGAA